MVMFYFLDKNANHAQETSLLSVSNTGLFQFSHLHEECLVNVLYFCTFIYQTSNLNNVNLLKAHWNLSCFCLLFFLARMPSTLLLNTCSSFKTRRQCHLSYDGFPQGREWSLAQFDGCSLLLLPKHAEWTLPVLFALSFSCSLSFLKLGIFGICSVACICHLVK